MKDIKQTKDIVDWIIDLGVKSFKVYETPDNSLYFKIETANNWKINLELFYENHNLFYSLYLKDKLIEENAGEIEYVLRRISLKLVDFNH